MNGTYGATRTARRETVSAPPRNPALTAVAESATPDVRSDPDASGRMEQLVGVGAAWKLGGQIGVQVIRLVTVAILARLLTPADYGAAAIAIALATFAPTVGDMGIGSALVQTNAETRLVRSTAFWASLGFGIALSVLLAVAAGPVGQFLDDPRVGTMVAVGGLSFFICSLGSASQAVFMREMKFRSIELRYWFALIVASALAVLAAGVGAGPWALVLQQIVLLATFAAALWWRAGWRPRLEFSGAVFRELGSFAIRIAGGRWARLGELLVLSLLIGGLVGVPALGAWSFAMSTVILPLTVIAIPIAEVLFSAFSRLRGERERIAALWLESIRFLAAVILPLLARPRRRRAGPDPGRVRSAVARLGSHHSDPQHLRDHPRPSGLGLGGHGRRGKAGGDAVDAACRSLPDTGRGRHRRAMERRGGGGLLRRQPADRGRDSNLDLGSLGASGLAGDRGGAPFRRRRRGDRDGGRVPARAVGAFLGWEWACRGEPH